MPLAHPSLCSAGPGFLCHWARRGAGPGLCPAVHSSPWGRQQIRTVRPPARGKLCSHACPQLGATLLAVPRHQASSSSAGPWPCCSAGRSEVRLSLASPLPACQQPPPARPCPRGMSARPTAQSTPALLPLAPLCFSRMLAEREERCKSQLQMSGNLFIKHFLKLLTQKKLAEDIKKHYIEKVSAATPVLPTRPWPCCRSQLLQQQPQARGTAAGLSRELVPRVEKLLGARAGREGQYGAGGWGPGRPARGLCSRIPGTAQCRGLCSPTGAARGVLLRKAAQEDGATH